MRSLFVSVVLLFFGLRCAAIPASHEVHETRADREWQKIEKLKGHHVLPMRIALTQSNLDNAEDLLMEV
jgi:tripeptidyl-peptidase I